MVLRTKKNGRTFGNIGSRADLGGGVSVKDFEILNCCLFRTPENETLLHTFAGFFLYFLSISLFFSLSISLSLSLSILFSLTYPFFDLVLLFNSFLINYPNFWMCPLDSQEAQAIFPAIAKCRLDTSVICIVSSSLSISSPLTPSYTPTSPSSLLRPLLRSFQVSFSSS